MYKTKNGKIYKDGVEINTYEGFVEILNFYDNRDKKATEEIGFQYHDLIKLRDDYSPFRKLVEKLNFENKINGVSLFGSHSLMMKAIVDFDIMLDTPNGKIPLQRPYVWSQLQKQSLIESMLKGIDISIISVCIYTNEAGERIYQVIDGKQRLSTILSFFRNEFPLVIDNVDYYYKDMDSITKSQLERYSIKGNVVYSYFDDIVLTDEDKVKWFERINFAGTPQDKSHIDNLKSKF